MLVIDLGTHLGDEVRLLASLNLKKASERRRVWLRLVVATRSIWKANAELARIEASQRILGSKVRIAMVEPMSWPRFMRNVSLMGSIIYFQGVTSLNPGGSIPLYLSKHHLGHSIFASKPGLTGRHVEVWNFEFELLWKTAVELLRGQDELQIVLRINIEGAEDQILGALLERIEPKPALIMGSLGDVKKVFGDQRLIDLQTKLSQSGIPFVYFTSLPTTWAPAMEALVNALTPNANR